MTITATILGGFVLGLGARRPLQRHVPLAFRATTLLGLGVLAFLAGWGFGGGGWSATAIAVVVTAQLTGVAVGARLFGRLPDGPLMAYALYGNPGFWSLPATAALFGPRAALGLAAYDLLASPRHAFGLHLMRSRAPRRQRARTALVDYAPMAAAVAGLALGTVRPAPAGVAVAVVVLGTVLSAIGAVLLGVAWPRGGWFGTRERRLVARVLAVHLTVVPGVLVAAALAGVPVPDGAWVLALGPLPVASLSFARVLGFSPRLAACGLAVSVALAAALLPVAAWLAASLPG